MRHSKYWYFFVLKYFGVRSKTDSAVLLIKKKNKESKDSRDSLIYLKKTKLCIQFTLKGFSPLIFILLHRKKDWLLKILERHFNYLYCSTYWCFINFLTWEKVFRSNFVIVSLLPRYFLNFLIRLVTFILKRSFIVLLSVVRPLLLYISP